MKYPFLMLPDDQFKAIDNQTGEEFSKSEDPQKWAAFMRFVLEFRRTERLSACDWTQSSDSPLSVEKKAAWQTYRQALRDLPVSLDFSQLASESDIPWPTPPQ